VNHYSYPVMFYTASALAMGSVIILYNVKETLPQPEKFSWKQLQLKHNELFEKTSLKPAIILLLLSFPFGCTVTLAPDLCEWLGMHNKGLFFATYTFTSLLIRMLTNKSSDRLGRQIVLIYSSLIALVALLFFLLLVRSWF